MMQAMSKALLNLQQHVYGELLTKLSKQDPTYAEAVDEALQSLESPRRRAGTPPRALVMATELGSSLLVYFVVPTFSTNALPPLTKETLTINIYLVAPRDVVFKRVEVSSERFDGLRTSLSAPPPSTPPDFLRDHAQLAGLLRSYNLTQQLGLDDPVRRKEFLLSVQHGTNAVTQLRTQPHQIPQTALKNLRALALASLDETAIRC